MALGVATILPRASAEMSVEFRGETIFQNLERNVISDVLQHAGLAKAIIAFAQRISSSITNNDVI